MSFILVLLALALMSVCIWGFQSVMAELAKPYPHEPINTASRPYEVEAFIWSSRAPRALRRRYIATQACFVPAALCLAALVWLNEPRPDKNLWGTIIFSSMSLLMVGRLTWAVIRHRV
jgi:hypothetical protein